MILNILLKFLCLGRDFRGFSRFLIEYPDTSISHSTFFCNTLFDLLALGAISYSLLEEEKQIMFVVMICDDDIPLDVLLPDEWCVMELEGNIEPLSDHELVYLVSSDTKVDAFSDFVDTYLHDISPEDLNKYKYDLSNFIRQFFYESLHSRAYNPKPFLN